MKTLVPKTVFTILNQDRIVIDVTARQFTKEYIKLTAELADFKDMSTRVPSKEHLHRYMTEQIQFTEHDALKGKSLRDLHSTMLELGYCTVD